MKLSYVYILTDSKNQKLYIGITSNLIKRISEHKNHIIEGYTRRYNLDKLVYFEEFFDIKTAIKREKNLKGKLRKKKLELINSMNPDWIDLYEMLITESDLNFFIEERDKYLKLKQIQNIY